MLEYDVAPVTKWSFSRLKNFEACPYRVALQYAEKLEMPEITDDNPMARGTRIHQMCEDYVRGVTDEPDELISRNKVLEVLEFHRAKYLTGTSHIEEDWAFDHEWKPVGWDDEEAWVRMKLDAGAYLDESHTLCDDWKSGKSWGNELKIFEQGSLYAVAWMMRNPKVVAVTSRFIYTDENKIKPFLFNRASMMTILKRFTERGLRLTLCTQFKPKPSRMNCRFCPFGPNNGTSACPHGVVT